MITRGVKGVLTSPGGAERGYLVPRECRFAWVNDVRDEESGCIYTALWWGMVITLNGGSMRPGPW